MSDLIEQLKPLLAQLKHPVAEAAFLELAKSVQAKNDEIERLTAELSLYRTGKAYSLAADEIERLTEIADTNYSKWKEQVERTRKLLARVEALEGVVDAAVAWGFTYNEPEEIALVKAIGAYRAATEQDKPPFYTGFPTMHPPATEQEGET